MNSWDYGPSPRRPIPQGRNIDGRRVWQPSMMVYDHLIGSEYEQQRKTVLKYFGDGGVKTTAFMDDNTQVFLLDMYRFSIREESDRALAEGDAEREKFFEEFVDEIRMDKREVVVHPDNYDGLFAGLRRRADGNYFVTRTYGQEGNEIEDYLEKVKPWECSALYLEDENERKISWEEIGGAVSEMEDEGGTESSFNIQNATAETTIQPDQHILDSRSATEGLELAFLSTPASTTPLYSATFNTPTSSSIDNCLNSDEEEVPMDLVTL